MTRTGGAACLPHLKLAHALPKLLNNPGERPFSSLFISSSSDDIGNIRGAFFFAHFFYSIPLLLGVLEHLKDSQDLNRQQNPSSQQAAPQHVHLSLHGSLRHVPVVPATNVQNSSLVVLRFLQSEVRQES